AARGDQPDEARAPVRAASPGELGRRPARCRGIADGLARRQVRGRDGVHPDRVLAPRPRRRLMTPPPLILDVDTGIDDSLAPLSAAASAEAELGAVTCVGGNVDARQVERNTRSVLELAGRLDLEVALGDEQPLVRPVETTPETHGPQGLGYAELPPAKRALSDRHAVDVWIEHVRARPGEVTLVTCGPLTNLARALEREPEFPRLLR